MTTLRRRDPDPFHIHEDGLRTEDTEMMAGSEQRTEEDMMEEEGGVEQEVQQEEEEEEYPGEDDNMEETESSDDGEVVDSGVQTDMDRLSDSFPGFRNKYRLIKRIGEGTFSTVYKAEDIQYDNYYNDWDIEEKENPSAKWTPPPLRRFNSNGSGNSNGFPHTREVQQKLPRRKPRFVAIKKIYVTSSPSRIFNELDLLNDLRNCPSVCPLITAFRYTDQVVAILPYFRHEDFRDYFRHMTVTDMSIYLRSLFTALAAVHDAKILHRDIKPTNFLYDPAARRGVLVDFGLAEREGSDCKPCLCHEQREVRHQRVKNSVGVQNGPQNGYPKSDTRPSRRANRAGTRGFRAPEVLFKCTEQTTKIDIWSAGVILLTIMSKRFPFFNSADDVEAMIEIGTIFGSRRMRHAGQLHGCIFDTNIPTIGNAGFSLEKIILWSTCRTGGEGGDHASKPLDAEEKLAVDFLGKCLELDPARRLSAREALEHDFLKEPSLEMDQPLEDEEDEINLVM